MSSLVPVTLHDMEVLVVGGGGAGIRAAIAAAEAGRNTLLAVNGRLFETGSTFYEPSPPWGILSAHGADDTEDFYEDVLHAAGGCVDERLVRILCQESWEAVEDLKSYGIPFRTLGELGVTPCFGKAPRGYALSDMAACKAKLAAKMKSLPGLMVAEELSVVSLLVDGGVCYGALAFDREGTLHVLRAGATVMACGGGENLYRHSFRYGTNNGAAYAMAARHGARIANLEFIQFINAALSPVPGLNYNQHTLITMPDLKNGLGEYFLERYLPEGVSAESVLRLRASHGPYSVTTDSRYFDESIALESERTGIPGAVVTADAEKLTTTEFRLWTSILRGMGLSPDAPITIYPHCHAFNGGILLSGDVTTDIRGLYACGESAGGCHGANRMGGNAMLGTQVFGKRAGQAAAAYSGQPGLVFSKGDAQAALRADCVLGGTGAMEPAAVLSGIQDIMQVSGFLRRCESSLADGLQKLEALNSAYDPLRFLGTDGAADALETFNALCAARLILTAMRERRESRGGHCRTDYPERSDKLRGMQTVTFSGGDIRMEQV